MLALLYKIRRAIKSRTFIGHYFSDKGFRIRISLLLGLVFNLGYLIFNIVSGIVYGSSDFITVSVYYALLLSIRYIILTKKEAASSVSAEILTCRRIGTILFATNALITVMIFCAALTESTKNYSLFVFTVLSVYAIFNVARAGIGIYLGKRNGEPIHKAAYSVRMASLAIFFFNLASAVVSRFVSAVDIAEILRLVLCALVSMTVLFLSFSMMFVSLKPERK